VYPFLEFQPEGGWDTFHAAGVSGIPTDPFIPDTGAAIHVKLYDGYDAADWVGAGTAGVIDAPPAVPAELGGMGDEEPHGIFGRNVISPAGVPIIPGLETISGGPVYFICPG
jgi:hypothetical protein